MKLNNKKKILDTLQNILFDCYELDFLEAEKKYREKRFEVTEKIRVLNQELEEVEKERLKYYKEYLDFKAVVDAVINAEEPPIDTTISQVAESIAYSEEVLHPEEWKRKQQEKKQPTIVTDAKLEEVSITKEGDIEVGVTNKVFENEELVNVPFVVNEDVGETKNDLENKQQIIDSAKPLKKSKPIIKLDPVFIDKSEEIRENRNNKLWKEVAVRRKKLEDMIRKNPGITAGKLRENMGYGGAEDGRFNSDIAFLRSTFLNSFLSSRNLKESPSNTKYFFEENKKLDLNGYKDHNFDRGLFSDGSVPKKIKHSSVHVNN